jgi:hypothetical protein
MTIKKTSVMSVADNPQFQLPKNKTNEVIEKAVAPRATLSEIFGEMAPSILAPRAHRAPECFLFGRLHTASRAALDPHPELVPMQL